MLLLSNLKSIELIDFITESLIKACLRKFLVLRHSLVSLATELVRRKLKLHNESYHAFRHNNTIMAI